MKYRADIDGLRAIAVLIVIFYHTGITFFAGGYVGVDVFFVISGFLITGLILDEIELNDFSVRRFYARRLRRLFPALATTIILTLTAGVFFLRPDALVELAWSSIGAIFSVSNIQFYFGSGYWDFESLQKPLLHTWSLGVEEQFYILWPPLIMVLASKLKNYFIEFILAISVISVLTTAYFAETHNSATFFLMPFRIYEFGIGAVVCYLSRQDKFREIWELAPTRVIGLVGLACIASSMYLFRDVSKYPSWIAVIPCIGAGLVLISRTEGICREILENAPTRHIGQLSYSLYLVHWPVIVYFTQGGLQDLGGPLLIAALVTIYLLSACQYYFIERPFRYKSNSLINQPNNTLSPYIERVKGGWAPILWVAVTISICVISLIFISRAGLPGRYSQEIARLAGVDFHVKRNRINQQLCSEPGVASTVCGQVVSGTRNVLIVGDSKGVDGLNILSSGYPDNNFLTAQKGGCPFRADLRSDNPSYKPYPSCNSFNDTRFKEVARLLVQVDVIVISNLVDKSAAEKTYLTVNWLQEHGARKVIVFGNEVNYTEKLADLIIDHGSLSGLEKLASSYENESRAIADAALKSEMLDMGIKYLSKRDYFCSDSHCRALTNSGMPVVFDWSHLTYSASAEYGRFLKNTAPELLDSY